MEPENNTPEEQEQSSSNTYPGQWSSDKAQKLYNITQTPKKIKNLKKAGKKMAKNTGKMAKRTIKTARNTIQAARAAYAAAQAAYAAASAAAAALGIGWEVIIIIIIVVLIIFLLKEVGVLGLSTYSNPQLASSGPVFAKIGDKLDYTISVNYPGTAEKIIITDQIPEGTEYVNAPQATYNPTTNTVTWNIAKTTGSASGSLNNINTTLSLTLLATKDNNYIVNTLKGIILGGVLGINDSSISNESITPTLFQATPTEVVTPTLFQKVPSNTVAPTSNANVIKSCVVTKIGEPAVIPSLPPECTSF